MMVLLGAALRLRRVVGAVVVHGGRAGMSAATPHRGEALQRHNEGQQQHERRRGSPEECHNAQNIAPEAPNYT